MFVTRKRERDRYRNLMLLKHCVCICSSESLIYGTVVEMSCQAKVPELIPRLICTNKPKRIFFASPISIT